MSRPFDTNVCTRKLRTAANPHLTSLHQSARSGSRHVSGGSLKLYSIPGMLLLCSIHTDGPRAAHDPACTVPRVLVIHSHAYISIHRASIFIRVIRSRDVLPLITTNFHSGTFLTASVILFWVDWPMLYDTCASLRCGHK